MHSFHKSPVPGTSDKPTDEKVEEAVADVRDADVDADEPQATHEFITNEVYGVTNVLVIIISKLTPSNRSSIN